MSPLSGEIEMDETFVARKAKNMHKAKRAKALNADGTFKGKTIVVGMLERHGRVKAEVVVDHIRAVLHQMANNCRDCTDLDRFELAVRNISGKRLTYDQLTGVGSATSH